MPQHFAIAGAGLIGAAIAWNLARRGAGVTVVDRAAPGAGASGASFGWINASFSETPAYFRLRSAAVAEYGGLADRLGCDIGLVTGGSLWWEDEGAAFDAQRDHLAALGYAAEEIGAARFAELEPAIQPPDRAIFAPGEAAIDAAGLAAIFLARAAALGTRVLIGPEVTGFLDRGGRVAGLQTTHGPLAADISVIAAGTGTGALLATAGVPLPMANKRGLILHTLPVAPITRRLILTPDIHFRQAPDGSLVAGEVFSGDGPSGARISQEPAAVAEDLLVRLCARLPGVGGLTASRVMLGTRPVPRDGLPAIGPAGPAGLYAATMHSGVTLGPLVGRLVAEELCDGTEAALLAPFRPARFG